MNLDLCRRLVFHPRWHLPQPRYLLVDPFYYFLSISNPFFWQKKIFCCCIVCQKINNGSHFSPFRRKLGTCKSQLFNFINSSCFFHTSYVSRNRKLHFFFLCQELSCARHIFVWKWLRLEYFDQYLYNETCVMRYIYICTI